MESFLDKIADFGSVAIVGMAKNTGKTECLNFVLGLLYKSGKSPAITSIGVDGENIDSVTHTHKPEIVIREGTWFVTSEAFYHSRRLTSEIISVGGQQSALGALVTAKAVTPGKAIISGPPDASSIRSMIEAFGQQGIRPVIVDGALSRKSAGAPTVTEAMVLTTGAALSPLPDEIVRRTSFLCSLADLPQIDAETANLLTRVEKGVWGISSDRLIDLEIPTALAIASHKGKLSDFLKNKGKTLFIAGAVTDGILSFFNSMPEAKDMTLVIRDFTCMFAGKLPYGIFTSRGGKCIVMRRPKLLGICVNPVSPAGFRVDSEALCKKIGIATGYPCVDVRKLKAI